MRATLLLLSLPVIFAYTYCQDNKACTGAAQCRDAIHNVTGVCCGAKCLAQYPVALFGQACDGGCGGVCAPGLNCSNGKCGGLAGISCPCTNNGECSTNKCSTFQNDWFCLAPDNTVYNGAHCNAPTECISQTCTNNVCVGKPVGQLCPLKTNLQCAQGLQCRKPFAGGNEQCLALCATDAASCCTKVGSNSECADKVDTICERTSGKCVKLPGNGADCNDAPNDCSGTLICEKTWDASATPPNWSARRSCQAPGRIALGQLCLVDGQCGGGRVCANEFNAGTNFNKDTCQNIGSRPLGALCEVDAQCQGYSANGGGNACFRNSTGQTACQRANSVANGQPCVNNKECVSKQCATKGGSMVCIAPNSVANGAACDYTTECAKYALCQGTPTKSCDQYLGKTCTQDLDCNSLLLPLECGCDGKCIEAPRQDCSAASDAWDLVMPDGFRFPRDLPALSAADLRTAMAYECCTSQCPSNVKKGDIGFTLDCLGGTATPLGIPSTCSKAGPTAEAQQRAWVCGAGGIGMGSTAKPFAWVVALLMAVVAMLR